MRRFLLTNPNKFTGTAEAVYNSNGTLCKIDLTQANMHPLVITAFKASVPAHIDTLMAGTSFSKDTTIVEADLEVTFTMFWDAYRKKINRLRAEALFKKLTKTQQVSAYYGISKYDAYLRKEQWRSKADPETYLRNQMWENEWR